MGIHLLPTAYPSKKLANSREKKKKKISRFNSGAQNSTYSHFFCLREKTSNQFEKFFSPSLCFLLLLFSYSIFSLSSNLHIKLEKKRNILKEKKINYKSRRWHILPAA